MNQRPFTPAQIIVLIITTLFFAVVLAIAYSGNGPSSFAFLKYIPGEDKTGHVILLCVLSLAVSWALSLNGLRLQKVKVYYGILTVFVFITAEEFIQILSPHRSFDFFDLACNYIGILIGWRLLSVYENRVRQRGKLR